jgi:hypothetical protein
VLIGGDSGTSSCLWGSETASGTGSGMISGNGSYTGGAISMGTAGCGSDIGSGSIGATLVGGSGHVRSLHEPLWHCFFEYHGQ